MQIRTYSFWYPLSAISSEKYTLFAKDIDDVVCPKNYPFRRFLCTRVRSQSCGEWPPGILVVMVMCGLLNRVLCHFWFAVVPVWCFIWYDTPWATVTAKMCVLRPHGLQSEEAWCTIGYWFFFFFFFFYFSPLYFFYFSPLYSNDSWCWKWFFAANFVSINLSTHIWWSNQFKYYLCGLSCSLSSVKQSYKLFQGSYAVTIPKLT